MNSANVIAKYFLADIGFANILCTEDIIYFIGIKPPICKMLLQIVFCVLVADTTSTDELLKTYAKV